MSRLKYYPGYAVGLICREITRREKLHHEILSDQVRDQIFFRNQKVATFATSSVEIGEEAAQCPYNDIVSISKKVTPNVGFKNYFYPSGGHSASRIIPLLP